MSLPEPPNPVTISYVGVCAGLLAGVTRALFTALPPARRGAKSPVSLLAGLIGGLYGAAIWVLALVGCLTQSGRFSPAQADALSVTAAIAAFAGLVGTAVALTLRYMLRRDIALDDVVERSAGLGAVLGFALVSAMPALRS